VNDEWRLEVTFDIHSRAQTIAGRLAAGEVEHDPKHEFREKVIVSRDDSVVFVYAASRDQIGRAEDAILRDAEKHGWRVESRLRRWHPIEEEWEDPGDPLPASEGVRREEREALMTRERAAAEISGYPEFEVRADLPSHHDAVGLSERLNQEGLPAIHRWRYLVVGATDEDNARELADRIKDESPPRTRVKVEGTWAAVTHDRPNPFILVT
jgi:hypothetical protein